MRPADITENGRIIIPIKKSWPKGLKPTAEEPDYGSFTALFQKSNKQVIITMAVLTEYGDGIMKTDRSAGRRNISRVSAMVLLQNILKPATL
jgi:hypothetical protein